ncbi:Protein SOSEKI 1 [Linum grandiflorum]
MEVAAFTGGGVVGSNGGGGEFRRLHIVYFLTRMGRIEHPHLIRVRHLNRNGGVFLRDVKRWMGELRGKDLPDSFSWSYKRKYKTGYIWQDLIDDDLITPISDNEYVLKGSEITVDDVPLKATASNTPSSSSSSSTTFEMEPGSNAQNDVVSKDQEQGNNQSEPFSVATKHYSNQSYSSTSSSSPIADEPSTTTPIIVDKTTVTGDDRDSPTISSYYNYTFDHRNKSESSSSSQSSPAVKSRSSWRQRYYSNAASSRVMLRRLIACGGAPADTAVVDAVLVAVNKSTSTLQGSVNNTPSRSAAKNRVLVGTAHELQLKLHRDQQHHSARRRKDGFEGSNRKGPSQGSLFCRQTDVSASYRPVGAPTCTQCGKSFRPEKLHMHMSRSCRGMRKYATADDEEMAAANSPCKPFVKKQLITATTS